MAQLAQLLRKFDLAIERLRSYSVQSPSPPPSPSGRGGRWSRQVREHNLRCATRLGRTARRRCRSNAARLASDRSHKRAAVFRVDEAIINLTHDRYRHWLEKRLQLDYCEASHDAV